MGSKRKVFLYELVTGKTIEFDSQTSAGEFIGVGESTIRKYNNALALCREGHEDMAAIRLKKILSQNPKLIKGYHLLALIQMKNQEWNKARRTLKKAARIDKTNTTTLRFLREVDEQTGVTTKMEKRRKGLFGNEKKPDLSAWLTKKLPPFFFRLYGCHHSFLSPGHKKTSLFTKK